MYIFIAFVYFFYLSYSIPSPLPILLLARSLWKSSSLTIYTLKEKNEETTMYQYHRLRIRDLCVARVIAIWTQRNKRFVGWISDLMPLYMRQSLYAAQSFYILFECWDARLLRTLFSCSIGVILSRITWCKLLCYNIRFMWLIVHSALAYTRRKYLYGFLTWTHNVKPLMSIFSTYVLTLIYHRILFELF